MLSLDAEAAKTLAEALALGLLFGAERYKDRDPGEEKSAGVRTFAGICVLGAVCGLLGETLYTAATFLAVAILLAAGYFRAASQSVGLTTEVAALLVFWLGYLLKPQEALAIGTGIVMLILLASKRTLHDFVKKTISEREMFDTLKFLAVVFVALPLLPQRDLGPYGFFNPYQIWVLIILVSSLSYLGYILVRVMGPRRGLLAGSLLGGLVSTTAVTVALAARAREDSHLSTLMAVASVLANAMQFPRILVLVWAVDHALGRSLAPPLIAMFLAGCLGAALINWSRSPHDDKFDVPLTNPYSLWPALKFGMFFVAIFFFSAAATDALGAGGFYWVAGISGLGSAGAISLSAAKLVGGGNLALAAGSWAVLLAMATNSLLKLVLARVNGTPAHALRVAAGMVAMLAVGGAVFLGMTALG